MNPYVKPFPENYLFDSFNTAVKDGDIVMGIIEDGSRYMCGCIVRKVSGWGNRFEGPHPEWGQYCLLHGWGNFPSSLAWAKHFIIIDNCLSYGLKRPLIGDYERCYELWTENNREFDFNFFKEKLKSLL